jgi:uncharacterized protein YaiL (DUF2058 family)
LLKAGLVTEKQARQAAQQEQQRQFRDRPKPLVSGPSVKPGGTATTKPNPILQQAQAAKVARDQELNRRREDKAQRRARLAQIEQIIEQNRVPRLETEDHYSFIDGKKIRRMSVDPQRREQLTKGELVIVRYKGHYAALPAAVAQRIRERDENMIVPHLQAKAQTPPQLATPAADDPYKDFVVPDDLVW